MDIVFNAVEIAYNNGLLGHLVSGFHVTPQRVIQAVAGLRWEYQEFYDRGNKSHTVTFNLVPPPEGTTSEALREMSMLFENLPGSGALVWQEGGKIMQMANAVLPTVQQARDRWGVSNAFAFTFVGGQIEVIQDEEDPEEPPSLTGYLLDETGALLLDETGAVLLEE